MRAVAAIFRTNTEDLTEASLWPRSIILVANASSNESERKRSRLPWIPHVISWEGIVLVHAENSDRCDVPGPWGKFHFRLRHKISGPYRASEAKTSTFVGTRQGIPVLQVIASRCLMKRYFTSMISYDFFASSFQVEEVRKLGVPRWD
jgi:hypothetical protein